MVDGHNSLHVAHGDGHDLDSAVYTTPSSLDLLDASKLSTPERTGGVGLLGEQLVDLSQQKRTPKQILTAGTSMLRVPRLLLGNLSSRRALEATDAGAKEAGSQLCSRYGPCVSADAPSLLTGRRTNTD